MTATAVTTVQASLAQAGDGQVALVVAMVDALRDRGDADALVAPLRGRLAQLRPVRPLSVRRLLFSPADPLIVPPERWQRGSPNIPRSALVPIAASVADALPEFAGIVAPDAAPGTLVAAGAPLWAAASRVVDPANPPPRWKALTGLGFADYPPIAAAIAAVWACAPGLLTLGDSPAPPPEASVLALLRTALPWGTPGLAAIAATLLVRLPADRTVLAALGKLAGPSATAATEGAVGHMLDVLEGRIAGAEQQGTDAVAQEAVGIAAAADALATAEHPPEIRGRIEGLRRSADAACRRQFRRITDGQLSQALAALATNAGPDAIEQLEGSARALRRLEAAGQRLGAGEYFAAALRKAAAEAEAATRTLEAADHVRLVEILAGPEAAFRLLNSLATPSQPEQTTG